MSIRLAVMVATIIATTTASELSTGPESAAASIHGTVRNEVGAAVPLAHVALQPGAAAAITDSGGRYRLSGVASGSYQIRVVHPAFAPAASQIVVRGDESISRNFTLIAVTPGSRDEVSTRVRQEAEHGYVRELPVAPATPEQPAVSTGKTSAEARNAPRSTVVGRSHTDETYRQRREPWNTEEYALIRENGFQAARSNPLSTFGIDVDKASYANTRRFLLSGQRPPVDAVRIEELVNYFPYDYPEPRGRAPFSILTDVAPSPWNPDHQIVRIALQGARSQEQTLPPSNLVFLIDVSGSMQPPDKLPLVKASFRELVRGLRPQDRVAIVVYAGSAGLVLPSTDGEQPRAILDAINRLEAGGSTAGGAGIRLAYAVARQHFLPRGNNRVILATDGDFNVGTSSESELLRLIEQEGKGGIHLTVLG